MRFFKYSAIALIIAIATNCLGSLAYSAPVEMILDHEIPAGGITSTDIYTKNTYTEQYYDHVKSFTALTNPCTGCYIKASLVSSNNILTSSLGITMGHIHYFGGASTLLRDYQLKIQRTDWTALTTYHIAAWGINPTS